MLLQRIRVLLLLVCLSILPGVYAGGPDIHAKTAVPSSHRVAYQRRVAVAYSINAEGFFDVIVRTRSGYRRPLVRVNTYAAEPVHIGVHHHTLYLSSPWHPLPGLHKRPRVTVYLSRVKKITTHGPVNIYGRNIASHGLIIHALGLSSSKIRLRGKINVRRIYQPVGNHVSIRWVNSPLLSVFSSHSGSIRLAGVVKTLYARVLGHAQLHGAYLRANTVFVKAKNNATAYVTPVNELRAFATQRANIYFYKTPKFSTRDSVSSGNVFQMAWHN